MLLNGLAEIKHQLDVIKEATMKEIIRNEVKTRKELYALKKIHTRTNIVYFAKLQRNLWSFNLSLEHYGAILTWM